MTFDIIRHYLNLFSLGFDSYVKKYTLDKNLFMYTCILRVIISRRKNDVRRVFFMINDLVEQILSKQNEDGFWGGADCFYTDKYRGTVWTVLILAELNANPNDIRVRKAIEFLLTNSYDPASGGFSIKYSKKFQSGLPSQVIPCLTGNMVFSMIRLGYLDDPRIQKAIEWIVNYQRADDGEYLDKGPEKYSNLKACFSTHSCFMGVVKSLKALSEIPVEKRSEQVNKKIDELVEFILIHHVYKRSSNHNAILKPGWTKFGFPLMYQTDVLEIMDILTTLQIKDDRTRDAVALIKSKEKNGLWILENSYNGKTIIDIETKREPSQYITKKAKRVINFHKV